MFDSFIKAYVADPGEMSFKEAFWLAFARDQEANDNFIASLTQ